MELATGGTSAFGVGTSRKVFGFVRTPGVCVTADEGALGGNGGKAEAGITFLVVASGSLLVLLVGWF